MNENDQDCDTGGTEWEYEESGALRRGNNYEQVNPIIRILPCGQRRLSADGC